MEALDRLRERWLACSPRRAEVAALVQDFASLLLTAPVNPQNLFQIARGCVARLQGLGLFVSVLRGFLKHTVNAASKLPGNRQTVASPYVGGLEAKRQRLDDPVACPTKPLQVGSLNPGRTGLQTVATNEVLWWRLQHIMEHLIAKDIAICFLPSARWPEGAPMPEQSPFELLGIRSASWSSIGVLIRTDALHVVSVLEDFLTERTIWLGVSATANTEFDVIIGGFYASPGGDEGTWALALQQFQQLQHEHGLARCYLMGDGNAHFSHMVTHELDCHCSHCKQSPADRRIETSVRIAGLEPLNGPEPTHDSGNTIDVVLGLPGSPRAVTFDDNIGGSDHKLICLDLMCSFSPVGEPSLAIVHWAHPDKWSHALTEIEPVLMHLAELVSQVDLEVQEAPSLPNKRKRSLLDACAWCREALYLAVGHFSSAVAVKFPKPFPPPAGPARSSADSKEDYASLLLREQTANLQKFAQLVSSDPSQAQSFLSGFFRRSKMFRIGLQDPLTQRPASSQQCAEIISRDLVSRSNDSSFAGTPARSLLEECIKEIRRRQAPASGVVVQNFCVQPPLHTTANRTEPYSMGELETSLQKVVKSKKAVHCPLAALKAECPAGRELSLTLCNLGRTCAMSPKCWGLRHVSPIRKAGPSTVDKVKNLRPISRASDLSSLQDSLWMGRCKPFLDQYTGHMQFGGKFDAVAVVVTLVLHAQLRQYQGLLTYLLFADLKYAFDVADWNLMLLSCFSAGVVGKEWLLLDDFFQQDHAAVVISGFLSTILKGSAGIPQGRRFSMHAFMSSMHVLRQVMDAVAATSRALLPDFARAAMEGCWTRFIPAPPPEAPSCSVDPMQCATTIKQFLDRGEVGTARSLAVHALDNMESFHDRVLCMEVLGVESVGPLFFVDDVSAPYPDAQSVEAVLNEGLGKYARLAKAAFNFGPSKTATMACFDAPPAEGHVPVYKLLGIEIDPWLSFSKRLDKVCVLGRTAFEEFFHMAESTGLSIPVEALEVPRRVEPAVLYGAELLALAPGAETRLNELQAAWARTILGARNDLRNVSARLSVRELGWPLRLGTAMILKTILFFNKILLLPDLHPVKTLLKLALQLPCESWASRARALMNDPRLASPILTIFEWGEIPVAAQDAAVRKNALRRYKVGVVLPLLTALDREAYLQASTKQLPGLDCRFNQLDDTQERFIHQLLSIGHKTSWRNIRLWWLIRITGKWPVPLFATGNCVTTLPCCSRCGLEEIALNHVLGQTCCDPAETSEMQSIFSARQTADELFDSICFVGHRVGQQLRAAYWEGRGSASLHEGRLETWARDLATERLGD